MTTMTSTIDPTVVDPVAIPAGTPTAVTPTTVSPVEAAPVLDRPASGGLLLALVSAAGFATSGSFAKALLEAGWTPGAAVTARIAGAALALGIPTLWLMRGRLRAFADNWALVLAYGVVAVAGSQLFYFNAVTHLSVGVALLLEYLAPVLIVGLVWATTRRMPSPATLLGALMAMGGLALVIDLFGGVGIDPVGLAWGLAAACCNATYFLLAAREAEGLPPVALAAGGMVVGAVVLAIAGLTGVVPMVATLHDASLAGAQVAWWVPVVGLALLGASVAYGFGVAATRRLGSTVASFVGLTEVIFAIIFAWILLGELPAPVQLAGGALILAGVATVKIGESRA